MHKDDNNHVGWLLFYGMKAKSRDTKEWKRINARDSSIREIKVREVDNAQTQKG